VVVVVAAAAFEENYILSLQRTLLAYQLTLAN